MAAHESRASIPILLSRMRALASQNAAFLKDIEIHMVKPWTRSRREKDPGPEKSRAKELDRCLVILNGRDRLCVLI